MSEMVERTMREIRNAIADDAAIEIMRRDIWNEAISAASDTIAKSVKETERRIIKDALQKVLQNVGALKR